jgi:hypothetical protein
VPADDSPDSENHNAEVAEADRELGEMATEMTRKQHFPDFNELVLTGVSEYEPRFIYRNGNSFLVVDTEVRGTDEEASVLARRLDDGRVAERGTRDYLVAGIRDLVQRTKAPERITGDLQSALSGNRVQYVLVTVLLSGPEGNQELDSIEHAVFEL